MHDNHITLIAVDVDGTLLNSHHALTPRVAAAIRACQIAGVHVVIATGKTRSSVEPLLDHLQLDTPGVYSQGLIIHNADGSIRFRRTMEPEQVAQVIAFAQARAMPFLAYSGDRLIVLERSPYTDSITNYGEPLPLLLASFDGVPVEKFILIHTPETIAPLRHALEQTFDGQLTVVQALDHMIELVPPGSSKGDGLRRVLAALGVAPEQVMAIGDGENDIEMLQLAGLGVAVGNAKPALKAVADVIVADNDHDGVAEAIERFVLAGREA